MLINNSNEYKGKTKDEIIKLETTKLDGIFSQFETKTKKSVNSLISEAAFMGASLYELREIINEKGYTEEYQNGANQCGVKKCSEMDVYIQLSKNYMSVMKQLTDLLPKLREKGDKVDGFDNFVNERE